MPVARKRKMLKIKPPRQWTPWYFENSKLPVRLSKISPIKVWAFSFACWVFCRGEMSARTKRHETIHYQQQLEMLFVFQWICYGIAWLIGYAKHKNGRDAYYKNPFEQEAYELDDLEDALEGRKRYGWIKYKI